MIKIRNNIPYFKLLREKKVITRNKKHLQVSYKLGKCFLFSELAKFLSISWNTAQSYLWRIPLNSPSVQLPYKSRRLDIMELALEGGVVRIKKMLRHFLSFQINNKFHLSNPNLEIKKNFPKNRLPLPKGRGLIGDFSCEWKIFWMLRNNHTLKGVVFNVPDIKKEGVSLWMLK